ncbi:hypothetical protein [Lysinibacillus sp. NPDC056232]
MKCFYTSCMAMLEGLDVLKDPIAVIGNFELPVVSYWQPHQ